MKSDLKGHIASIHEGIKTFKCEVCDFKTAKKINIINWHAQSVHEGIKPFQCIMSEHKAGLKATLKVHIEAVHAIL